MSSFGTELSRYARSLRESLLAKGESITNVSQLNTPRRGSIDAACLILRGIFWACATEPTPCNFIQRLLNAAIVTADCTHRNMGKPLDGTC